MALTRLACLSLNRTTCCWLFLVSLCRLGKKIASCAASSGAAASSSVASRTGSTATARSSNPGAPAPTQVNDTKTIRNPQPFSSFLVFRSGGSALPLDVTAERPPCGTHCSGSSRRWVETLIRPRVWAHDRRSCGNSRTCSRRRMAVAAVRSARAKAGGATGRGNRWVSLGVGVGFSGEQVGAGVWEGMGGEVRMRVRERAGCGPESGLCFFIEGVRTAFRVLTYTLRVHALSAFRSALV